MDTRGMSIRFQDTSLGLSGTLRAVRAQVSGESITLAALLGLIGEQGLLLFVMFLMVPFLLPVSIPGMSTVFSLVVILVGAGVVMNRIPWLPPRLLAHAIAVERLMPALDKAIGLTTRIERVIRPRWSALTHGATLNRWNGMMIILSGVLLLMPFVMVPFANTLPGLAVLLLAAGMIQRDGLFVLMGYLMVLVTLIYFGALIYGVVMLGVGLQDFESIKALLR